jgi:hypothetical protein
MADRYDWDRDRDRDRERNRQFSGGRGEWERGRQVHQPEQENQFDRNRQGRDDWNRENYYGRDDARREQSWAGGDYRGYGGPERSSEFGQQGDWGRQGSWGTFGNRPDYNREREGNRGNYGNYGGSSQSYGGSSMSSFGGGMGTYGERGQHTGRGPKGWQRSDERIREDINERLTDHPHIDATEIDVQVKSGEVTLTGTVDDRHTKRMAEEIAENVSGVKDVHNQLRVQAQAGGSEQQSGQRSTAGAGSTRKT